MVFFDANNFFRIIYQWLENLKKRINRRMVDTMFYFRFNRISGTPESSIF
jgi:hypothetical protein